MCKSSQIQRGVTSKVEKEGKVYQFPNMVFVVILLLLAAFLQLVEACLFRQQKYLAFA